MIALARKYRPKSFADVAVQTHVSNTLRGAIARGRVAHGYLLCGPRGVGKTTLARVLAMALNCENRSEAGEPCGVCTSCTRIWSGSSSLDVVEIDAASNRGVDDARDLRERAMYAPSGEKSWKAYIIDEAHMLTREAWNALLKILEEPPPRVVFVFATTEPQRIAQFAAPVLSRLQRFDLKRIGASDIQARLITVLGAEGVEFEADALGMIVRAADGSMRDALSLTDQVLAVSDGRLTPERVREALGLVAEDEYLAMLDLVIERRPGEVFAAVSRLMDMGVDLGLFLGGFGDILRAQLATTLGGHAGDLSERAQAALAERKGRLATGDLLRMLSALSELEPRFRRSTQQQLLLETLLVRFALLDRTVAIEDMLRGITASRDSSSSNVEPPDGGSRASSPTTPPPPRVEGMTVVPRFDSPASVPRVTDVAVEPRRASTSIGAVPRASIGSTTVVADADARPAAAGTANAGPGVHVSDLNAVSGAWDDIVGTVRRVRPFVASLLEHAIPTAAGANGELTLRVESASLQEGLNAKHEDVVSALRPRIAGLRRLVVQTSPASASESGGTRMTVAMLRSDTLAALRKGDPLLAAAIDVLDLDMVD